jgi:hypothetical protein
MAGTVLTAIGVAALAVAVVAMITRYIPSVVHRCC